MFKIFFFLSFLAVAFAKPGYIHSAPAVASYHAAPAVHVVRPVVTSHSIATPLIHHHAPALIHHGSYHHGLY